MSPRARDGSGEHETEPVVADGIKLVDSVEIVGWWCLAHGVDRAVESTGFATDAIEGTVACRGRDPSPGFGDTAGAPLLDGDDERGPTAPERSERSRRYRPCLV